MIWERLCLEVQEHAGLFSNANDLAIFMQMYLQGGEYAGERFFEKATVEESLRNVNFVKMKIEEGAGFDKAALPEQEGGPACDCNPSPTAFLVILALPEPWCG